jgi:ubiquinone/menaquinone biosynthesis C-methylase UbiE
MGRSRPTGRRLRPTGRRIVKAVTLVAALLLLSACSGVTKLDLTTLGRDSWQRPADVVDALDLLPGDRVADLGAGEGYFVPRLTEAVGAEGRVYAVDTDEDVVEALVRRFPPESTNVEVVRAKLEDPMLPDGSLDVILIVNTYHHIEDRPAYFRRLRRDLRPGGRVAVIDPNEDLRGILALALDEGHKSSAPVVEEEMRKAGYRVEARHDFLPVQIFRVFVPDPDAG